jgi:hypothetical protein
LPSARHFLLRIGHGAVAITCGAAAAFLLGRPGPVPPAPVHEQAFRLAQQGDDVPGAVRRRAAGEHALRVTPAKPLLLPYVFGDCDLFATVTLPRLGELDLAFRKLEPAGTHGRFSLLRLSADRDGPAWWTREQALFAGDRGGGLRVAAGLPASVRLELRGRVARADVAGRAAPSFEAVDDRGSFAFVVRGGEAEISHLQVVALPAPAGAPWPVAVGGLLGALVAMGCAASRRWRRWAALALLPAAAWATHRLLAGQIVPGALAGEAGTATLLAALALFALAVGRPGAAARTALRLLLVLAFAGALLEVFARLEASRLAALQDPRHDLLFGVDSGPAPFDALAKQLHGKNEVHAAEPDLERVVFLGGGPMFEADLDRAHHLAVQATARAGHLLGQRLVAAVFPTPFPHTLQQTALFQRYYADAYPALAVVLGVDRWEALREGTASARTRLARADASGGAPPASYALELLRPAWAAPARIASPAELQATLEEFVTFCAHRGLPLILATHAAIPGPYLAVVEAVARAHSLPLVCGAMTEDDRARTEDLARVLVQVLRR